MSDPYARYTRLTFDRPHPKVLRVTMDNGRMNTADEAMHAELADIWRDIDRDDSVHVAILTGAGKVFSAGGDFNMIRSATEDFNSRARQWKEAREMVYSVINCNKPVVSAMRGVAVGAGRAFANVADVPVTEYVAKQQPKQFKIGYSLYTGRNFGIPFRPDDVAFRNQVEQVVEQMKADGSLVKIYKTWFGKTPPEGTAMTTVYEGFGPPGFTGYSK